MFTNFFRIGNTKQVSGKIQPRPHELSIIIILATLKHYETQHRGIFTHFINKCLNENYKIPSHIETILTRLLEIPIADVYSRYKNEVSHTDLFLECIDLENSHHIGPVF